jgi:hypothetical protein
LGLNDGLEYLACFSEIGYLNESAAHANALIG